MRKHARWHGVSGLALVAGAVALAASSAFAGTSGGRVPSAFGSPMDLVWISDSTGWGVAPFYARRIRSDLGRSVHVQDRWEPSLSALTILERLRSPRHPWLRLIREAEVIVVSGNPIGLPIKNVTRNACVSEGPTVRRPLPLGPGQWAAYVRTLTAIYARIFEIRGGRPVILRTQNWYVPVLYQGAVLPPGKSWQEAGVIAVCTRFWESLSAALGRAAKAYGVGFADLYTAFNGETHMEDPIAKGYIQADNIHPNDAGRKVIADAVAALGYERVKRPR